MIKFIPHHKFPKKQVNRHHKAQIFDKKDVLSKIRLIKLYLKYKA